METISYFGGEMCVLKTADFSVCKGLSFFRLISLAAFFLEIPREVEERRKTLPFPQ